MKGGTVKPGDRFKMGTVTKVLKNGDVMLGRDAERGEECPPEHTQFKFGKRRVFQSDHIAPHRPEQVK